MPYQLLPSWRGEGPSPGLYVTSWLPSSLPPRIHPVQPEERMPHLLSPNAPGMSSMFYIEVIGNMQLSQFRGEGQGIGIVGLIPVSRPQEDRKRPISWLAWKDRKWAILLAIVLVAAPNGPFSLVIAPKTDDRAKQLWMMAGDVHRAEPTGREASKSAVPGFGKSAIMPINIRHQIEGDSVFQALVPISAVTPLRASSWPPTPIRGNQNEVAEFVPSNQLVGGLSEMPPNKPILLIA